METSIQHSVPNLPYNDATDKPANAPANASSTSSIPEWYQGWYLGLGARSILALLSPLLVAVILVTLSVALSVHELNDKIDDAKREWQAGCTKAQDSIQHLRNWGFYAAPSVNAHTQQLVEITVHTMGKLVMLSITALEAVLVYIVDSYRDTFLCFIVLLVQGTLSVITDAVDLFNKALTTVANGIRTAIQDSVKGINDAVDGVVKVANDMLKLIHKSVKPPHIKVPDLSALKNVTLPDSFTDGLHKINNSMPSMSQIDDQLNTVIRNPLNTLKTDVNTTTTSFKFNGTMLPQPPFHAVNVCNDMASKFDAHLDNFAHDLTRVLWYVVLALAIIGILLALFFVFQTWWEWRTLEHTFAQLGIAPQQSTPAKTNGKNDDLSTSAVASNASAGPEHQTPIDQSLFSILRSLATTVENPLASRISLWVCKVGRTRQPRHKSAVGWCVTFLAHPVLLLLFAVAALGMLAAGLQLAAVNSIMNHHFDLMDDFGLQQAWADANQSMHDDSAHFANKSNTLILNRQNELNDHLFRWVNSTTSTMNNTLNDFTDTLSGIMNKTFTNTPLYGPMQHFIYCLIGKKVDGIEEALTWIHNHSHADFPTISPTLLTMGDGPQHQMHKASAQNASSPSILEKVVASYRKSLHVDLLVNGILLLVWAAIVLGALTVAIMGTRRKPGAGQAMAGRTRSKLRPLSLAARIGGNFARSTGVKNMFSRSRTTPDSRPPLNAAISVSDLHALPSTSDLLPDGSYSTVSIDKLATTPHPPPYSHHTCDQPSTYNRPPPRLVFSSHSPDEAEDNDDTESIGKEALEMMGGSFDPDGLGHEWKGMIKGTDLRQPTISPIHPNFGQTHEATQGTSSAIHDKRFPSAMSASPTPLSSTRQRFGPPSPQPQDNERVTST